MVAYLITLARADCDCDIKGFWNGNWGLFTDKAKLKNGELLIPSSWHEIKAEQFCNCRDDDKITKLIVPSNIKKIGNSAFRDTSS